MAPHRNLQLRPPSPPRPLATHAAKRYAAAWSPTRHFRRRWTCLAAGVLGVTAGGCASSIGSIGEAVRHIRARRAPISANVGLRARLVPTTFLPGLAATIGATAIATFLIRVVTVSIISLVAIILPCSI
eukprot:CAMPEP_0119421858 /NCGR_PEP_ID=MMETSP1335-20130426/26861_1 /TAXON_ID=259385 /ORGANISM="Chrysoculter rhomboideus, Strain RCC1486" /LENGTH=128 /DNA_ID=CAMNT_0007447281 /DNA_START=46 /DNA_END=433 /DNA_ORIENTATION=-